MVGSGAGGWAVVVQVLPHPLQVKVRFGFVVAPNNENETEAGEVILEKLFGCNAPEEEVICRVAGHPRLFVTLLVIL
jgi:hypothetical protein